MRALKGRPAAKITSAFDPDAIVLEIYILLRLFENIDILEVYGPYGPDF